MTRGRIRRLAAVQRALRALPWAGRAAQSSRRESPRLSLAPDGPTARPEDVHDVVIGGTDRAGGCPRSRAARAFAGRGHLPLSEGRAEKRIPPGRPKSGRELDRSAPESRGLAQASGPAEGDRLALAGPIQAALGLRHRLDRVPPDVRAGCRVRSRAAPRWRAPARRCRPAPRPRIPRILDTVSSPDRLEADQFRQPSALLTRRTRDLHRLVAVRPRNWKGRRAQESPAGSRRERTARAPVPRAARARPANARSSASSGGRTSRRMPSSMSWMLGRRRRHGPPRRRPAPAPDRGRPRGGG